MTVNNRSVPGIDQLEELQKSLSLAGVGILIVDSHKCIIQSNGRMKELLDADEELFSELIGIGTSIERQLLRCDGTNFDARIVYFKWFRWSVCGSYFRYDIALSHSELEESKAQCLRSREDANRFAYVVSHDLQEPIRAVMNYTGLLKKQLSGKLEEKTERYLSHVTTGATRVQAMIQGLLRYSLSGERDIAECCSQLQPVIRSSLSAFQSKMQNLM